MTSNGWKTIPLFISSTFRDMHAERDQLNAVVFPAIEALLWERRCRLQPIDLRVGVPIRAGESVEEREKRILKVCLQEIDRSRPFLLVLLGDRYGWVPKRDLAEMAAGQVAFEMPPGALSVTALEIAYGLTLKPEHERLRSVVMLREPLPYDKMGKEQAALYSEIGATNDEDAPKRLQYLKEFKRKLTTSKLLKPYLHWYSLGWDNKAGRPTSLDDWGKTVQAALWEQLDVETAAFARKPDLTWQEQESFALEEFTERLDESFVGRKPLVMEAMKFALSPATDGAVQAWCVTGKSGAGKSAFFSHIHRSLLSEQRAILLIESGGISPRAGHLHWTLRRWIGELAAVVGVEDDLPDSLYGQELEAIFAKKLEDAATKRRVILMADALNQFERTDRMISLSWLPDPLPANVRLLATSIPGPESEKLHQRKATRTVSLPPFNSSEIENVAAAVYAHYGRTPATEIVEQLKAIQCRGQAAAGNALWLALALELLNLLDADDFAEALTYPEGKSVGDRTRQLVLNRCKALPPTIEGLYTHFLGYVERACGVVESRTLAALLALSRHGLREVDLHSMFSPAAAVLFPDKPAPVWDDLRFATFRRFFRSHLVARGEGLQWNFTHATLRAAIQRQLRTKWKSSADDPTTRLHSAIADYLETSPDGASIRDEELTWHTLGTRDLPRFAHFYLRSENASEKLSEYLIEENTKPQRPLLKFVLSSIADAALPDTLRIAIGNRLNFDLYLALDQRNGWAIQQSVVTAVEATLSSLHQDDRRSLPFTREVAISYERLGDVQNDLGHADSAREAYSRAIELREKLHSGSPEIATLDRDLAVVYNKVADLHRSLGDRGRALDLYHDALRIGEKLRAIDPSSPIYNRDLSVIYERLGDIHLSLGHGELARDLYLKGLRIAQDLYRLTPHSEDCARDLATSYERIGDIHLELGKPDLAIGAQLQALHLRENLRLRNPQSATASREALVSYERLSEIEQLRGHAVEALEFSQKQLDIALRLSRQNPQSAVYSRDLAVAYGCVGDLLQAQGKTERALNLNRKALRIASQLHGRNQRSVDFARLVATSLDRMGDSLAANSQSERAAESHRQAFLLRVQQSQLDPTSADLTHDLSVSNQRMGDVHLRHGDAELALGSYSEALRLGERLLRQNPRSADFARSVFTSYERMIELQLGRGNSREAFVLCGRQLDVALDRHRHNPQNVHVVRDLCATYEKMGDINKNLERTDIALELYDKAVQLREDLLRLDPISDELSLELSASYGRIGDLQLGLERREAAFGSYSRALNISEGLRVHNPQSIAFARSLAVDYERMGDYHRTCVQLEQAAEYYHQSLDLREEIRQLDAQSVDVARDLWVSYWRIADIEEKTNSGNAAKWCHKTFDLLLDMKERGTLLPKDGQFLEAVRLKLS